MLPNSGTDGRRGSSWPVRRRLSEAYEIEVSAPQILKFEQWGLISRDRDSSWPLEQTVERLRRIHQVVIEAKRLLPLPRRVVYLRATNDDLLFDIADSKVAEALVGMPSIVSSYQKLQRVYAAYRRLGDHAKPDQAHTARRNQPRLPRQPEWHSMLKREAERGVLANKVTGFFHWRRLFPMYGGDLSGIPEEECIYLTAVVDAFLSNPKGQTFG